ncbi:Alpha/Beta hydrolase protein [Pterulicium gracile]|uniref:Alpha/Beta hydrolase protein n=1 Tax=Pterulicium gracile TaxID=1884261 RepID=A0A5C3R3M3_9AGAR|nr:Alpha/Beta hydrolase protein [Pterula gracilis]
MEPIRYSTVQLPDGARLAYQLFGAETSGLPLVLICGTSGIRSDWNRLSRIISKTRPVLVYDHRGIGDSSYSALDGNDSISVESMARDLLFLLASLPYRDWAVLGFALGGIIAQQLALLPHQSHKRTSLPFRISHLMLIGTKATVLTSSRHGLPLPAQRDRQPTEEERHGLVRNMIVAQYDPRWVRSHETFIEQKVMAMIKGRPRPVHTIMKQRIASMNFDFGNTLAMISSTTSVLVVHGRLDQVIPFDSASETLARIPRAQFVQVGTGVGQLPSLDFGHLFHDYFTAETWVGVIDAFTRSRN